MLLVEFIDCCSGEVVLILWCTVFQSAKTNLNVEQVFFSIARDIKTRLAETDSKPEVRITVLTYVPSSILFNLLRDLFLLCRTRPSRLTRQKAPTHRQLRDLLAVAPKGLLGPDDHCLFDIIQFLLVCYTRKHFYMSRRKLPLLFFI
jgi:hypothetical protein